MDNTSISATKTKTILSVVLKKQIITEFICSLFIILFIYTGINKFLDYDNFKFQLGRSPFLADFKSPIALLLPGVEVAVALTLVFKRTRMIGLYLSYFLMLLFTGYIWIMLNYSYDLPCTCGGVLSSMSWHTHLVFNACFSLLALSGLILQSTLT